MKAIINNIETEAPAGAIAWKYEDPEEPALWIYSEREAKEIAHEDPGLIEWVQLKKGYYSADTASGVMFYDTVMDIEDAEILDPWPFYESLEVLEDDNIIYGFFDTEDPERDDLSVLRGIKEEFGIYE